MSIDCAVWLSVVRLAMYCFQGKLIKCFGEQLEVKKYADPNNCLPELKHYPSVTKLLIVIGVSTTLIEVRVSHEIFDLFTIFGFCLFFKSKLYYFYVNVDGL